MKVEIRIDYYKDQYIFKDLIDELKSKKATIIEGIINTRFELDVNSFDEIICLLENYSKGNKIQLVIYNKDKVVVFISRREPLSFGNQVD